MNSISDYVVAGFSLATQRFHMVILDMTAKFVWLAGTVALFGLAGVWFGSRVLLTTEQIAGLESGVPGIALLETLRVLATRWDTLAWALLLATVVAASSWVVLEAFMRGGMLSVADDSFLAVAVGQFGAFLLSGLIRRIAFISIAGLVVVSTMGPLLTTPVGQWGQLEPDSIWPAVIGLMFLAVSGFSLMTLDTILRTGSLDCCRSDFFSVIGTIGFVTLVELGLLVMAAVTGVLVIGVVGSPGLGILLAGLLMTGASGLHSYMLLVRHFSLGIMRHEKRRNKIVDDGRTS